MAEEITVTAEEVTLPGLAGIVEARITQRGWSWLLGWFAGEYPEEVQRALSDMRLAEADQPTSEPYYFKL